MAKDNPHSKHRERVKKEFLEIGFPRHTPHHKVLEMLLFYSIPRKDTNEIAHALLDRFGSVRAIFNASPYELMQVDGIGENSAAMLKLLLHVFRIYEEDKPVRSFKPNSADDICDFIMKKYIGFTTEAFALSTFNNRGELIAFDFLSSGDTSMVGVSIREVVTKVLERKASSALISHNHPTGDALPSDADIITTEQIHSALGHINVPLFDHIIVSNEDDDCISMAQTPDLAYIFKQTQDI